MIVSINSNIPAMLNKRRYLHRVFNPMGLRYVIIVDDDVDPSNLREVLFALGQRGEPANFEIIKGNLTSKLEPLFIDPEKQLTKDFTISTAIVLAANLSTGLMSSHNR